MRNHVPVLVSVLLLVGCTSLEQRFDRIERSHREELAKLYPVGTDRTTVISKIREQSRGEWNLRDPAPDRFAALAYERAKSDHGAIPTRCDRLYPLRATIGSSFGAFGMWEDFVFYDSADRVIVAYRRFLD